VSTERYVIRRKGYDLRMAPTQTTRPAPREKRVQPKLKKFLVYLDPEVHERLRRIGFEQKQSIASLVRQAVAEYLKKHDRASK